MNVTVHIPDDLARQLDVDDGKGIERRALEAFGADEYRAGRLTQSELRRLLGFSSRAALDTFLKARDIFECYDAEDLAKDLADLDRAGI